MPGSKSGSLGSLKKGNRLRVLEAIMSSDAMSRAEVARRIGLAPSTVSNLPTPDVSSATPNMSATSGNVALVSSTTKLTCVTTACASAAAVVDLVGFGTGAAFAGTAAGTALCSVSNETTTVKSTDPVFFTAVLKHRMNGDQTITLHVTKDGEEFVSLTESPAGTPFDCYTSHESMGNLEAGSYVFEIIHNKDIEATGNLTVQ